MTSTQSGSKNGQYANDMYGHLKAFQNKLRPWKAEVQKGNKSHFQTLKETGLPPEKKTKFADQLQNLLNEFLNRFQDFKSHKNLFDIFFSPFHTDVDKTPTEIQLKLVELQARTDLKTKYMEISLGDFYRKHFDQDKFPQLKKFVASKMSLFGSTYVCEKLFSKLGFVKSLHRSILTNEHGNWTSGASTSIKVNLFRVVEKPSQLQNSH